MKDARGMRAAAMAQAISLAERTGERAIVYRGPPTLPGDGIGHSDGGFSVWYVRRESEPAPDGAAIVETVAPEAGPP